MKIVLLTGDAPNQAALAHKMDDMFNLTGLVIEERRKSRKSPEQYISAAIERLFFNSLNKAWYHMLEYYKDKYSLPDTETMIVHSVNSDNSISFIESLHPDLIVVSGTSLIRERILNMPVPFGIINLHTGLSPYVKGGPNCTNWCLANNTMHLIGNTVMYIDKGIDSGDIIATEFTPLTGKESPDQLHLRVMEHAHDLLLRIIRLIETKQGRVPSVSQQSIAEGRTFYTKNWNFTNKLKARLNFRKLNKASRNFETKRKDIVTVYPQN